MNDDSKQLTPGQELDHIMDFAEAWIKRGERPSWDEYFMSAALMLSARSSCERLHVGCVLVSQGEHGNRILATAYNGYPPQTVHKSEIRSIEGRDREQAVVHAEVNAICDAARRGVSVDGARAYITHYPCIDCSRALVSAGIREIKYHADYYNDPFVGEFLGRAGVSISQF